MEKIGRDWLSLPSPCQAANAMPMRQSGTNPMPIESPFWIGDISPIHGASRSILRNTNTNTVPIQAQTKTLYVANPIPIGHQSAANPLSMPGHWCQSIPIWCQSNVNPMPIQHQSVVDQEPIRRQSVANSMPIRRQSISNPSQFDANQLPMRC